MTYICPNCSYALSEFDKECPRCAKYGTPPKQAAAPTTVLSPPTHPPAYGAPTYGGSVGPSGIPPAPAGYGYGAQSNSNPDDGFSFGYALAGFIIPIAGLICYFVKRSHYPLKARSALQGAGANLALSVFVVLALTLLGGKIKGSENAPRSAQLPVANATEVPGTSTQSPVAAPTAAVVAAAPAIVTPTSAPGTPGGKATQAEYDYVAKLVEWDKTMSDAVERGKEIGGMEGIAYMRAKLEAVHRDHMTTFAPARFASADSLIGQGLSKMKIGIMMLTSFGSNETKDFEEGARIYQLGVDDAKEVAQKIDSGQR